MRILTALLFLAILTGCGDLLSLHPIYTPQDKVFDAAYEGRWESDDDILTVKRSGEKYEFTLENKKPKGSPREYEAHLLDIRGVRFVDLIPATALGHMFAKVRLTGGELRISFFDTKWLRDRIPHEDAEVAGNESMPVVILKTGPLRKLVARYALEPKAYDKDLVYRRK
ncbi:MAG: hypothetical protein ABI823_06615 [Bryobacteraceae bacterium]